MFLYIISEEAFDKITHVFDFGIFIKVSFFTSSDICGDDSGLSLQLFQKIFRVDFTNIVIIVVVVIVVVVIVVVVIIVVVIVLVVLVLIVTVFVSPFLGVFVRVRFECAIFNLLRNLFSVALFITLAVIQRSVPIKVPR